MKRRCVFTAMLMFLLLVAPSVVRAEKVKVRVFSTTNITQAKITFETMPYNLIGDGYDVLATDLTKGDFVDITPFANEVEVSVNGLKKGSFESVAFITEVQDAYLYITPKGAKQRSYKDDMHVSTQSNKFLKMVNHVEFESYVAGVAQSEIYGKEVDIFRVQAIISRTWAMRNMEKHKADGYNFCDNVHCQAYYNRCIRPEIEQATKESMNEVLVDNNGNLIETPFHSNSGGQTANSEDVWQAKIAYLRSVQDTFSFGMKQTYWTKEFATDKWLNYFAKNHKLDINNDSIRNELVNFEQDERKSKLMGVPLKTIRKDWNLKSTFFSVVYYGDKVVLEGKGYGHGVGLSQEGAIRMVRLGMDYKDILEHYYTDAQVVKLGAEEEESSYSDTEENDAAYLAYAEEIQKAMGNDIAYVKEETLSTNGSKKNENNSEMVKVETPKVKDEDVDRAKRSSSLAERMMKTKEGLDKTTEDNEDSEEYEDEEKWTYVW